MLSGKPLFPGRDCEKLFPPLRAVTTSKILSHADHHQLTLILDVLGTPSIDDFYSITSRRSRDYLRALPLRKPRDFATIYPNASPLAVDFLKKTLTFSPKNRITVEEALAHPYLANYRMLPIRHSVRPRKLIVVSISMRSITDDPEDEPVAPPLDPSFFDFDLEKDTITKEALKQLLYDEVMMFKVSKFSLFEATLDSGIRTRD